MRHRFLNDVIRISYGFREARPAQTLSLGLGFLSLGFVFWSLGIGFWSLGLGFWSWAFVFGLWAFGFVVVGLWLLVLVSEPCDIDV